LVHAGFRLDGAVIFPILNLQWHDDTYSKGLAGMVRDFVGRRNDVPSDYPDEWYDEFARLGDSGQYFFCTNRYIFRASKSVVTG
jgi:hypothetical protein